jgi:alkylhydroperoxidase/carboxymuconolactone decarboxylase family protein YurZ
MTAQETPLDTGLDFAREEFTPEEAAALLKWYEETHGEGDLTLNLFADFLINYDSGGIKAFRRNAIELSRPDADGDSLPPVFFNLLYLHLYTVLGRETETLYEIVSCKVLGVTKAEVLDTIRLGYLTGGPSGINAVAERGRRYLDEWAETSSVSSLVWPAAWHKGASLSTGLDISTTALSADESQALRAWYSASHGAVPAYVDFMLKNAPSVFKTFRFRGDRLGRVLPLQAHLLMLVHLAAYQVWPGLLRQAATEARAIGVSRHQVLQAMFSGCLIGGEWKLGAVLEPLVDFFENWPTA